MYFLGLNPAGKYSNDERNQCKYSFDNNLNYYKNLKRDYCSFLDEYWKDEEKYNELQKYIVDVLKFIIAVKKYSITPREVFSTNINFIRSKDEDDLLRYNISVDLFWEYHQKFLELIKPDIIICSGYREKNTYFNSSYSILKEKLNAEDSDEKTQIISDGNIKYFKKEIDFLNTGKKTVVIGIHHLSIYKPDEIFYNKLKAILDG